MRGFAGLTLAGVGSRRAYFDDQTVGLAAVGIVSKTGDLPAYATLDLRGGINWNGVTLSGYVRNVADKRGAVALYGAVAGADLANGTVGPAALTVIQPRTSESPLDTSFEITAEPQTARGDLSRYAVACFPGGI